MRRGEPFVLTAEDRGGRGRERATRRPVTSEGSAARNWHEHIVAVIPRLRQCDLGGLPNARACAREKLARFAAARHWE
jgi:hypothetical protein